MMVMPRRENVHCTSPGTGRNGSACIVDWAKAAAAAKSGRQTDVAQSAARPRTSSEGAGWSDQDGRPLCLETSRHLFQPEPREGKKDAKRNRQCK